MRSLVPAPGNGIISLLPGSYSRNWKRGLFFPSISWYCSGSVGAGGGMLKCKYINFYGDNFRCAFLRGTINWSIKK